MRTYNPIQRLTATGSVVRLGIAALLMVWGSSAFAEIALSKHDFSANGWANGEICVVCHAPHNASNVALGPLWNHAPSVATYTLYGAGTPVEGSDMSSATTQPAGVSKLCLSCHDGSIAVDSFGGATGTVFVDTINAAANIGETTVGTGDLSNDHPIAFTYPSIAQDAEIIAKAGTPATVGGVLPLFGTAGSETLECASCHDVHNTGLPAGRPSLLRVGNAVDAINDPAATASGLCLTCHDK